MSETRASNFSTSSPHRRGRDQPEVGQGRESPSDAFKTRKDRTKLTIGRQYLEVGSWIGHRHETTARPA